MPLSVWVGENDPHEPGLVQVTDQSNPAFEESSLTVAIKGEVPLIAMELIGTPCVICTEIGLTIVTLAVTLKFGLAADVAVTKTVGGLATVAGAVKVAATPLAVCAGTIEPQRVLLAAKQATVQSTPALVGSFEMTAATVAVAFVIIVLGGDCEKLSETGAATTKEANALKLWSAVAKAVRVTVVPTMVGICAGPGTINVKGAPGSECCEPGGVQSMPPHVAFQSTPSLEGSPATVARTATGEPAGAEAGGGCVMTTPVMVEVMVTVAEKLLLRSVVERALMLTVLREGTARGATNTVVPPLAVCAGENEPQLGALAQVTTQSTPS